MRDADRVQKIYSKRRVPLRVQEIIRCICEKHRLFVIDILGHCRLKPMMVCRKEIYQILRESEKSASYRLIRQWFGRHHTSIIAAIAPDSLKFKVKLKLKREMNHEQSSKNFDWRA